MTTDFLATRTKHAVSIRRRRGHTSSGYDKMRILRRAGMESDYLEVMSPADGATNRDEIFMDWIAQQFRDLKVRKVTRTEAAKTGGVSRNQTYEWEGRGQKGFSRPKPETIKEFCLANGLDWKIPFRILGYDTTGRSHEELLKSVPESDLDRHIRLIKVALDQNPPTEERRRLERLYVRAKRQREDQRQMDEEIAELLGGREEARDEES